MPAPFGPIRQRDCLRPHAQIEVVQNLHLAVPGTQIINLQKWLAFHQPIKLLDGNFFRNRLNLTRNFLNRDYGINVANSVTGDIFTAFALRRFFASAQCACFWKLTICEWLFYVSFL